MNATTFVQKLQDESIEHVSSLLASAYDQPARNVQTFAAVVLAGLNSAAEVRDHLVENAGQAWQDQITAAAQWSRVKTVGEALELQRRLAREAWEINASRTRNLGGVLWTAWERSLKPLTERRSELAPGAGEAR